MHYDKALAEGPIVRHEALAAATAEHDCAPWDGPAFALWIPARGLGGPDNSWISLKIWSPPEQANKPFTFPNEVEQRGQGIAVYYSGLISPKAIDWAKQPRQQLTGTVRFSRVGKSDPVVGELDLTSDGNLHLKGRFEAQWIQSSSSVLCG